MAEWTQERLDDRLAYWQKVLRLQDWDVKALIMRVRDMDTGGAAEVTYKQSLKNAVVRIRDPIDDSPDASDLWGRDIEEDLVHELLHLHFAPFMSDKGEDDRENIAQEVAIEQISRGLVALERQKRTA